MGPASRGGGLCCSFARSSLQLVPAMNLPRIPLVTALACAPVLASAQAPFAAGFEGEGSTAVEVVNLGLALATEDFQLDRDRVVFGVPEGAQGGQDLNGDGDGSDKALCVLDLATGSVSVLPGSLPFGDTHTYEVRGGRVAYVVEEFSTGLGGTDLNGDGDTSDDVLHVTDLATGTTTNLALATSALQDSDFQLGDGLLYVRVAEGGQGGLDLNGDGDASDGVAHVIVLSSGEVRNLGVASQTSGFATLSAGVGDGFAAFLVSEASDGATDHNGDGDATDVLLATYDEATDAVTFSLAGASDLQVRGDVVTFLVSESASATDLNGDADLSDLVVLYRQHENGAIATTSLAVNATFGRGDFELADGWLTVLADEGDSAQDWNADGDTFDRVMHVVDVGSCAITNLGVAVPGSSDAGGSPQSIRGELLAFTASESRDGNRDHNGDGDAFDKALFLYDRSDASLRAVGYAVPFSLDQVLALSGESLAFLVSEGAQRNRDANGDGDRADNVLHVLDLATGETVNTGLAVYDNSFSDAFGFRVSARALAFEVGEADQGGTDLNGDGDTGDAVQFVYDATTRTPVNLGLAGHNSGFINFLFERDAVLVAVDEALQGADLNGDGDSIDFGVLHSVTLFTAGAAVETFGEGLPGTGGLEPLLTAPVTPAVGGELEYRVSQGLGGSLGCLIVGLGEGAIPTFGGTLYVDDTVFVGTHRLDGTAGAAGAGGASFVEPLDDLALVGTTFYGQAGYVDSGSVSRISLSAALRQRVQ